MASDKEVLQTKGLKGAWEDATQKAYSALSTLEKSCLGKAGQSEMTVMPGSVTARTLQG